MLDLPGFGKSAEPPGAFTIFDFATFCLAYLDHHALSSVHYFGHSMGGRIGLILGLRTRRSYRENGAFQLRWHQS